MAITITPAISRRRDCGQSSRRFITSIGRLRFAVIAFGDRAQLGFAHIGQRGQAGLVSASSIPPTSQRQVSAVKRRCIGSSFIEDKTACSKMFHGGPRREDNFSVLVPATEQRFLFVECRNPNLEGAKVVLHSRCAPAGSSVPPSKLSAERVVPAQPTSTPSCVGAPIF